MSPAEKRKELEKYITSKLGKLPRGKMNWLLFACDMEGYRRNLKSMTGTEWIKGKYFPRPKK